MAWSQLEISKPHLAYAILGGFTSLFMLCSLIIKEKLYMGEATIATICGLIFGPHVAKIFVPTSWGNSDYITLELARILLIVQVFAAGVELPRAYMLRHWRSMLIMLLPVMVFGWLVCCGFMYALIPRLSFLEALTISACVTATDPVLASSIVGRGKFARRVPGHLRNMLLAESGCNDGMAIPFLYLGLYLIIDKPARHAGRDWVLIIILYECVFGCFLGAVIGVIARKAIKFSERRGLMDRESFLVFYFVLAVFCSGIGTIIGVDDLLVAFCAGAAFSWDKWFSKKTEESHVSNVIDLLLNLSFFVYIGAIMPWEQFHMPELDLSVWRLVVLAICVLVARRIPAVLAFKRLIPDVINWREALFAGHFGPIGVGAIYTCLLARAELEHDETIPTAELPREGDANYYVVKVMWPVVCFLVLSSIIVHGSSIAFFMLGKRINTIALTLTKTRDSHFAFNLPRVNQGQTLPLKRGISFRSGAAPSIVSSIRRRHPVNIQEDDEAYDASSVISAPSPAHTRLQHVESHPEDQDEDREEPVPSVKDYDGERRQSNEEDREEEMNEGNESYFIGNDLVCEDSHGNIISRSRPGDQEAERRPSVESKGAKEQDMLNDGKPQSRFRRFFKNLHDAFERNYHVPDSDDRDLGKEEADIENNVPRRNRGISDAFSRENSIERQRREEVLGNMRDSEDEDEDRPGINPREFVNQNNEAVDLLDDNQSDHFPEGHSHPASVPSQPEHSPDNEGGEEEEEEEESQQNKPNIRFLDLPTPRPSGRRKSYSSYRRGSIGSGHQRS
ncbi:plasma membrane alkali metal cation/H antiporter Sod22 [Schizosaccharomyces cryophilus OY26]|uniref:Plasma membrane alkali metal cation/H antiporter Sod22 n=1 Tax=Schizosaccharomyces cryophilus (strain OY26 / ATCC MYA-4695 / CBS 11777 / NBRC 106824 / NRRL Y48691) TaxID=653667 RepID=S9VYH5_SCHCR|nr:plasma membrane alkali metal cation/H antiporter Sod22 [Schizosaccharomyces cryophilus OY26]EPY52723.1 plasma membrane alkali metal cation/H antiporter Sod22 [Schizosaccharomyces cryophilus OY26]